MKPRHSNSLLLVWRVAELEARHLIAPAIEPTHLLLGLCKVVDLDLTDLVSPHLPGRDELLEELLRETRRLRTVLRSAGLDARTFRRLLRKACPERGSGRGDSQGLRRSSAAKRVFAEAEHLAQLGNSEVYPVHLLYATLCADDNRRDAVLLEVGVDKKRLVAAAKREVLASASESTVLKTRLN